MNNIIPKNKLAGATATLALLLAALPFLHTPVHAADPTQVIDGAAVTVSGSQWQIIGNTVYSTTYTSYTGYPGTPVTGTWSATNALTIGDTGAASLTVAGDGTLATTGRVVVGGQAGSSGTLTIASGGVWNFTPSGYRSEHFVTGSNTVTSANVAMEIGAAGNGYVEIASGGTAQGTGQITLGLWPGASGTLVVNGYLKTNNDLQLGGYHASNGPGGGAGANGTVIVGASGTLLTGNIRVGYGSIQSTGTMIIEDGSAYVNSAYLYVGHWGDGYYHLGAGSKHSIATTLVIGAGDDTANRTAAVGTAIIDGLFTATTTTVVGRDGYGTLELSGTLNTVTSGVIGNGATGSGTVFVRDGGLWDLTTTLQIGYNGAGYLEISGTVKAGTNFQIGQGTTGSGTVIVKDGGLWTSAGYLQVGNNGAAYLDISGTVMVGSTSPIGNTATGSGTAIVRAGGLWQTTTSLQVGVNGSAYLDISGTVTVGTYSAIGSSTFGSGTAIVRDGGLWQSTSYLYMGNASGTAGSGIGSTGNTLTIEQGGTVTASGVLRLGTGTNSNAELIVAGFLSAGAPTLTQNAIGNAAAANTGDSGARGTLRVTQTGTVILSGSETGLGYLGFGSGTTITDNASGTAIIDGVLKIADGSFKVGRSGHGYLEIGKSGTVTVATYAVIGEYASVTHTARPDGPTSGLVGGTAIINGYFGVGSYAHIGSGAGSLGYAKVSGSGRLAIGSSFQVGYQGTGTLDILAGGTVTVGTYSAIGSHGNGRGTVNVAGLWSNTTHFYLGRNPAIAPAANNVSAGILNILPGGTVTVGGNFIAAAVGGTNNTGVYSTGSAHVEGLLDVTGNITFGQLGAGYLDITSTGTVKTGAYFTLGGTTSATGTATGFARVAGLLDVGTNLLIGQYGAGTLEILNGGTVIQRGQNNYVAATSAAAASTGTLIIRTGGYLDTGARANATQANFGIGWVGRGSLLIEAGGTAVSAATTADNNAFVLGQNANSYGSGTIAGTLVAATGYSDIGYSGTGVLTIENGGLFRADRVRLAYNNANAAATVNLNGGVLEARQFILGAGAANVSVAFNGGTLRALADQADFFQNLPALPLLSATLAFDTQAFAVTATNALYGGAAARLVKLGAGSLALAGDSSAYAGAVDVRAGSLDLGPAARLGGAVAIGSGAAMRPTVAGGVVDNLAIAAGATLDLRNAPLTAGNITLADGALWQFSLTGTHALDVTGTLAFSGSGTFHLDRGGKNIADIPGVYTLATYYAITGTANFADWRIAASDFSLTGSSYLDADSVPKTLLIHINTAGVDNLIWQGGDGNWDSSTASFKRAGDSNPIVWTDGAQAVFTTAAGGAGGVNVTGLHTLYGLQFGTGPTDTVDYNLHGTGTLAAQGPFTINTYSANANATILTALTGASLVKTGPGALVIGGPATFTGAATIDGGVLDIAGTGTVKTTTYVSIGHAATSTGTATVAVAGVLDVSGSLFVGSAGNGVLNISPGGTVTAGGRVLIGNSANSSGTVTVENRGRWTTGESLYVGNYLGAGVLDIKAGGVVTTAATGYIAHSGTATVAGLWDITGNLALATNTDAVGVLTITPSGTVKNAIGYVGHVPAARATVNVDGLWDNSSYVLVGRQGYGEVFVGLTGTVKVAANTNIGDQVTNGVRSQGYLSLGGVWDNATHFIVGNNGPGGLDITPTGTLTVRGAYLSIGQIAGITGTATVAGVLDVSGSLFVGSAGNGVLNISPGGTVTVGSRVIIGNAATGAGALIVRTGGVFHARTGINVGVAGAGAITVETGGTLILDAATLYTGGDAGLHNTARGTVTIDGYYQSGANGTYYQPVGYSDGAVGVFNLGTTGTAFTAGIDIGREAGASGTVTIDGFWSATGGNTLVGNSGTGTLIIGQTGTLITGGTHNYLVIGINAGSRGDMLVAGYLDTGTRGYVASGGGSLIVGRGVLTITETGTVVASAATLDDCAVFISRGTDLDSTLNLAGLLHARNGGAIVGTAGSATVNIAPTGTFRVDGLYRQGAQGMLAVTLDPARSSPYITAANAILSGTLALTGGAPGYTPVAKASELAGTGHLILTATSGAITGNFATITGLGAGAPGYLVPGGHIETDAATGAAHYRAGYRLAWNDPTTVAHGTFDLAAGETFEVDIPLADRIGEAAPGWDKKSLTKTGAGTLVLSAQNTFTGALAIASGTLRLGGPATHKFGALVNNGVLDFGSGGAAAAASYGVRRPVAALEGEIYFPAPTAAAAPTAADLANPSTPAGGQMNLPVQSGGNSPHSINAAAAAALPQSPFRTVEVASLSGAGAFRMTVDPAARAGDRLVVRGDATGEHQLLLSAVPAAAGGDGAPLVLATVAGANDAAFTGGLDYNGINYAVDPAGAGAVILSANGEAGVNEAIRGIPGVQSLMWFASQDNLSRRLGELRVEAASGRLAEKSRAPDPALSVWARARAEHASIGGGTGARPFKMDIIGLELGGDRTLAVPDGCLTLGLYFGYGRASQDFRPRAGTGAADGKSTQHGLGLYAAWLHDAGWFADLTLAGARYKNEFTAADQSGNPTTGGRSDNALGATLELGRRLDRADGWFVEPAAQFSLARLDRGDYSTAGANLLRVSASDATVTRLRALVRAGRAWQVGGRLMEVSGRAGRAREDSTGGEIRVGESGVYHPALDGARIEFGLGVQWQPAPRGRLYFDYEYTTGDAYEKPYAISLGYRHDF